MKHPRQKGSRIRAKCKKLLEEQGWKVDVVEKTGKFVKIKDLFSLFDLICIAPNLVMFVQVASSHPHNHKPFKKFAEDYVGKNIRIVQFVWINYYGWVLYEYFQDGTYKRLKKFQK